MIEFIVYVLKYDCFSIKKILMSCLLGDSLEEFQWLLFATSNYKTQSTVTIWGTDPLTEEQQNKLLTFVDAIGKNRIYSDTTAKTLTANSCSKVNGVVVLSK